MDSRLRGNDGIRDWAQLSGGEGVGGGPACAGATWRGAAGEGRVLGPRLRGGDFGGGGALTPALSQRERERERGPRLRGGDLELRGGDLELGGDWFEFCGVSSRSVGAGSRGAIE